MTQSMDFGAWLSELRTQKPLVHNITNWVVTNVVANAQIAIGASPVMAYAKQEVADMARMASAVALNMGTLNEDVVEAMILAGKAANEAGVPVVFDPVGIGATPYRNETAELLTREVRLDVLRGNQGEIGVMLGAGGQVKGVDSTGVGADLVSAMQQYAKDHGCVVVATGEVDYVTDGNALWTLRNGHELLAAITGSGCIATGLLGAFIGTTGKNPSLHTVAQACVAALTCYNVAGELAAMNANGPGTFHAALFDELYRLQPATVRDRAHVDVTGEVQ